MRIVFVRHGDPDYARDCLTEAGKIQAEKAAERVAGEGICKIYASSCGRALETASYTAKRLGLKITPLDFMREIGWSGEDERLWHGHPWTCADDMRLKDGADLLDASWREHPHFKQNRVLGFVDAIPPEFDRLLAQHGFEREGGLYRCTRDNAETIAVFSHQGSSSVVLAHLLGMPFAYFCSLCPLELTSVTVVTLHGQKGGLAIPRLEILNDARHLRVQNA